jgi:N-carbamoyl-L-amino-acid hydrolase
MNPMIQPAIASSSYEPQRVLADLRELAQLTGNAAGAQRLAWGPVWQTARRWFQSKVAELGLALETDAAGNNWVALKGKTNSALLVGSHLDSVPNGGWLDGCLGVLTGLELLRRLVPAGPPPVTVRLVDWADEEGARFGRSLLGSAAASGTLEPDKVRSLTDKEGNRLPDVLRENGVALETMLDAHRRFQTLNARAYLEFHIEQGPVLESLGRPAGVVLGTVGLERHSIRFTGQAAHSGSTPIPMRRDAFLAAAELALECREIARRRSPLGVGAVCTVGRVRVEPDIVTAVPGVATISLDQRALDAEVLAAMVREAQTASERIARANNVAVTWENIFRAPPRPFDPVLIGLCEEAVREAVGDAPRLPSGPLHDATEMAGHTPTVMMFTSSTNGLSHCKEEDTREDHLETAIRAFLRLADKTIDYLSRSAGQPS